MVTTKQKIAGAFGVGVLAKSPAARRALVGILRQGGRTMGPWGLAAWLAYEGYIRRNQIRSTANEIAERLPGPVGGQGGDPTFGMQRHALSELGDLPVLPFGLAGAWPEDYAGGHPLSRPEVAAHFETGRKRRQRAKSKFNSAVGFVIKTLKKQAPKMARTTMFSRATKIASKANPFTKSRIGKGATSTKKLARKVRKKYWNTKKRLKR